jgi:hypothetical protein
MPLLPGNPSLASTQMTASSGDTLSSQNTTGSSGTPLESIISGLYHQPHRPWHHNGEHIMPMLILIAEYYNSLNPVQRYGT